MSWLLLRRGGVLWGVPAPAVRAVRRRPDAVEVRLDGAVLAADAAAPTLVRLEARPLPEAVATRLRGRVAGMAVRSGEPVLLVDPAHPPEILKEVDDG